MGGKILNTNKIEQKAVNIVTALLTDIDTAVPHITVTDKNMTFDGNVEFFKNENTDKKENREFSIFVQVKGRKLTKRFKSFPMDTADLKNMHVEHGAFLFVVYFDDGYNAIKLMYSGLTPVLLKRYINKANTRTHTQKSITIGLTEIPLDDTRLLEAVMRKFHTDCECQINIPIIEDLSHFNNKRVMTVGFDNSQSDMKRRLKEEDYYYLLDDDGRPSAVCFTKLKFFQMTGGKIMDSRKTVSFDAERQVQENEEKIVFGENASIDRNSYELTYFIKGTLLQRIKMLTFLRNVASDGYFYINDKRILLHESSDMLKKADAMLRFYSDLRRNLQKLRIEKDLALDEWKDMEMVNLNANLLGIIESIEKKSANLEYETPQFINLVPHDLVAVYYYDPRNNFFCDFLDFDAADKEFKFETVLTETGEKLDNAYYAMKTKWYLADNFSLMKLEEYIDKKEYTAVDANFIILQVLEVIRAYDLSGKIDLLNFAEQEILRAKKLDASICDLCDINLLQIKYRKGGLSESDQERLIQIKNITDDKMIKASCCILLGYTKDAEYILNSMSEDDRKRYKEFPIYSLLES